MGVERQVRATAALKERMCMHFTSGAASGLSQKSSCRDLRCPPEE